MARVRRDLIDDDEAPGPAEVVTYPEVKAFLKKQEKNGAFPAKPPEKTLGLAEVRARCRRRCARWRGWRSSASARRTRRSRARPSCCSRRRRTTAASPISRSARRPNRARRPSRCTFRAGRWRRSAAPATTPTRASSKGFRFLLANRQADGGWAWRGVRTDSAARPSSHLVTGMALRAFAASPTRRTSREARRAAELLATRFLQPDRYPDRKAASFWEQLGEPRFYTDVLDALDCVTAVGLGKENSGVRTAEAYVRGRQNVDGLWYPGAPAALEPRRQAAAAQRQGSRAGALADRAGADRPAPGELTGRRSAAIDRRARCS